MSGDSNISIASESKIASVTNIGKIEDCAQAKSSESEKQKQKSGEGSDSDTKMVSLTPILNKLFSPAAELIGDEIKLFIKDKIEIAKKKKRDKNLAGHFEAAGEVKLTGVDINCESVSQAEKLEEWIEGAQDVEPDNSELAKLWQKLLLEIATNKHVEKYIIQQAKHLTPLDARLLMKFNSRVGKRPYTRDELLSLQRLETLGFVESSTKAIWLPVIILSIPVIFLSMFSAINGLLGNENDFSLIFMFSALPGIIMFFSEISLIYLIIAALWAFVPYFTTGSIRSFSLSPLGTRLVETVNLGNYTWKEKAFMRSYTLYSFPGKNLKAIKNGVSWISLLIGPFSFLVFGLWRKLVLFILAFLFISTMMAISEDPEAGYTLRMATLSFSKLGIPIYFICLFALPFILNNRWREQKLLENGWTEVTRIDALNARSAIAKYQNTASTHSQRRDNE